jgi:hypothetical protein
MGPRIGIWRPLLISIPELTSHDISLVWELTSKVFITYETAFIPAFVGYLQRPGPIKVYPFHTTPPKTN